ncbi:HNH endonuclease [Bacillus cereus]|uniref:HNH endonuclease n=1 Tax=Bacillus cereus TaxID=1396 RepID=UPI000BF742BC|nr:HNH endonuclease [Bacillus cereus]PFR16750.1 hypothetical protein COK23_24855 [Bacillus cereus]PGK43448.1 hypothetical protein CN909_18340 [Bacillus cereus]
MSLIASLVSEVRGGKIDEVKETSPLEKQNDMPTTYQSDVELSKKDSENDRYIICRNESLEGDRHPITGIEFEKAVVEIPDGSKVEGVFPKFESLFDAQLDESQYENSDARQFKEANSQLKDAVENNPDIRGQFTEEQLEQIKAGDTPEGYVWHHSENPGTLQLVDTTVHAQTGHTGGRSIWGGGNENR